MQWVLAAAFVACVPAANWLISNVGTTCIPNGPCLVPVAPGIMAPSGVLVIGLALALRDAVQERMGRYAVLVCIALGALLTPFFAPPALAYASLAAFILSELLDFAVYDKLRRRALAVAVLLSGAAGAILDSVVFSYLAFGEVKWALGLIVAKTYASIVYAVWIAARRTRAA